MLLVKSTVVEMEGVCCALAVLITNINKKMCNYCMQDRPKLATWKRRKNNRMDWKQGQCILNALCGLFAAKLWVDAGTRYPSLLQCLLSKILRS